MNVALPDNPVGARGPYRMHEIRIIILIRIQYSMKGEDRKTVKGIEYLLCGRG